MVITMNNKTIQLLQKLKDGLLEGKLSAADPVWSDAADMFGEELQGWKRSALERLALCEGAVMGCMKIAAASDCPKSVERALDEMMRLIENPYEETTILLNGELERLQDDVVKEANRMKAKRVFDNSVCGRKPLANAFSGRAAIYTVVTGGYDRIDTPKVVDNRFDYICFTDGCASVNGDVWKTVRISNEEGLDNVRLARKHKILCHRYLADYDYSVYVDAKIRICGDLTEYIRSYSRGSAMLCFPHFVRSCAYEEASACCTMGKDDGKLITGQMDGYRREGFPEQFGLIDTACLVRQHKNETLNRVLECWWSEVRDKSRRDQLSIGYACWKNGFNYDICDLFIYDNQYICKCREWE